MPRWSRPISRGGSKRHFADTDGRFTVRAFFPAWLEPMAAILTRERFTGPDWVFECKLDGIRVLAFKNGADVRLLSRNQLPLNASYPSFAAVVQDLPLDDVIL